MYILPIWILLDICDHVQKTQLPEADFKREISWLSVPLLWEITFVEMQKSPSYLEI